MIHDLLQNSPSQNLRRDVCIIGAGAAGIALAVELERLGKSVFLLEGGGPKLEDHAQEPYQSEVVGNAHRGIHVGRVRAQGGTTTKWGGQILELDAIDFEEREWVEDSGWPFSKQHLAPFYAHALRIEGLETAVHSDTELWNSIGLSAPSFPGMESYLSRWCPEPNFARVHAKSLEGPAIDLWLHANAVEVLLEHETVQGIRCRTQPSQGAPRREAIFRANEYVFCLGTIESSRFFLQPRKNGNRLPWNVSGLLGRYFQDHIDSNAAVIHPKSPARLHAAFDNIFFKGYKYHPKVRLTPAVQQQNSLLNAGATLQFVSDIDESLAAIKATAKHLLRRRFDEVRTEQVLNLLRNSPLLAQQTYRYAVEHRAFVPKSAQILLRVHCEQEPTTESSIALSDQRDSLGLLRTKLDWKISPREVQTIRSFVQLASDALSDIAHLEPVPELRDDAAYIARCDDSNHHMGGMRMHSSPQQGVVDPDLKLNGTNNCFVCSGAVFPTSGFSNPTHTLIALAVRLAQHLDQRSAADLASAEAQAVAETELAGTSRWTA
jgi:choline dehydrogenase-like flavoprotein